MQTDKRKVRDKGLRLHQVLNNATGRSENEGKAIPVFTTTVMPEIQ